MVWIIELPRRPTPVIRTLRLSRFEGVSPHLTNAEPDGALGIELAIFAVIASEI
jgi:hypothetical protein